MKLYGWQPFIAGHNPAGFGDHRHRGSEDQIILVIEKEDFRYSCLNPQLLFISKGPGLKVLGTSY